MSVFDVAFDVATDRCLTEGYNSEEVNRYMIRQVERRQAAKCKAKKPRDDNGSLEREFVDWVAPFLEAVHVGAKGRGVRTTKR
eukprot:3045893-Pyramimonas_sp.AAC.1